MLWCEQHIAGKREERENRPIRTYVQGFWLPDGAYAQGRTARGFSMSRTYLSIAETCTRTRLIPAFGSRGLRDITAGMIDEWVIGLRKAGRLAPATINRLLQHLRTILAQAASEGRIDENPASRVRPVKLESYERGVLSPLEIGRLLQPAVWADHRHFTINLLAYATGMRLGEVRGLVLEDIHSDWIEIRHNWQDSEGLKEPKRGSCREVPISPRVWDALNRVIRETQPASIVFHGDSREVPMAKYTIEWNFNQALKRIGIGKEARLARHLSFHSWRHTANTVLRSHGVVDSKVRRVTGHKSAPMSERYTHFAAEDYHEVVRALEAVLGQAPEGSLDQAV